MLIFNCNICRASFTISCRAKRLCKSRQGLHRGAVWRRSSTKDISSDWVFWYTIICGCLRVRVSCDPVCSCMWFDLRLPVTFFESLSVPWPGKDSNVWNASWMHLHFWILWSGGLSVHKQSRGNLETFVACKTKAASLLDLFKQVDTFLNLNGRDEMLFNRNTTWTVICRLQEQAMTFFVSLVPNLLEASLCKCDRCNGFLGWAFPSSWRRDSRFVMTEMWGHGFLGQHLFRRMGWSFGTDSIPGCTVGRFHGKFVTAHA